MATPNTDAPTPNEQLAEGRFDVRMGAPESMAAPDGAPPMTAYGLDKRYNGDLAGHALGRMQAGGNPATGSAAYTALESFTGTLHGRTGGFCLVHLGLMHAGSQDLRIAIAPGSGTGELTGIQGEMTLRIDAGEHHYALRYRLA